MPEMPPPEVRGRIAVDFIDAEFERGNSRVRIKDVAARLTQETGIAHTESMASGVLYRYAKRRLTKQA